MHFSLFLNPNCSGLTNLCSRAYLAILLVTIFEIIFKPTLIREIPVLLSYLYSSKFLKFPFLIEINLNMIYTIHFPSIVHDP